MRKLWVTWEILPFLTMQRTTLIWKANINTKSSGHYEGFLIITMSFIKLVPDSEDSLDEELPAYAQSIFRKVLVRVIQLAANNGRLGRAQAGS